MLSCINSRKFVKRSRVLWTISRLLLALFLVGLGASQLHGQALPAASAPGAFQIGAMFNIAASDYAPQTFYGYGFYTTFDFKYHVGIEGEYHQINDSNSAEGIYERTYEIGPRYVLHYGRYHPYAKVMYGRGVFNYPSVSDDTTGHFGPAATLGYNIGAIGAGLDYRVLWAMTVRADYEYQRWFSFPPNGLTPMVVSVGVAYHFQ